MRAAPVNRHQMPHQVLQHSRAALQVAQRPLATCAAAGDGSAVHGLQRSCFGGAAAPRTRRDFGCQAHRDVDWDTERQRVPSAPPIRMPPPLPPPPPPPPPPRDSQSVLGPFGRRGALLTIMFGGAAVMSAVVRRDDPSVVTTREGVTIATTPNGNPVAVYSDEKGNIFMIDPNGNLYYDTGDPQLGFYFVDPKGTMLNVFVDGEGQPQYVPIGNIKDLRSVDASAIGGLPVADLEAAHDKQVKRLYAFPSEDGVALPDNAPAVVGKDGTVQPPAVLEEGALLLQEKKRWWPFGDPSDGGGNFKRG